MKTVIPIDSSRHGGLLLPFANEDETQKFVEEYFERIGLKVIASSRRLGRSLLKIDILAVNDANIFIIECKSNLIDTKTIHQLVRYRDSLETNQVLFQRRLADIGVKLPGKGRKPVLVAIGYHYRPTALSEAKTESVVCLTYAYHGLSHHPCPHVSPPSKTVESHLEGKVGIQLAPIVATPPHPIVCKRRILAERAKDLSPGLQGAFWELDDRVRELGHVTAVYGKNPDASYSVSGGVFAVARLDREEKVIEWCYGGIVGDTMRGASDAARIFELLRNAYKDASAGGN